MLEIFEAPVVNGLVGDEIVEYMGQGRTAVATGTSYLSIER